MEKTRIIISVLWISSMLIYLLGDVLRIFAGDFEAGKIDGVTQSQGMWLFVACIMLIPIIMGVLTLTLRYPLVRRVNIIIAIIVMIFNFIGLPYKGLYDNFLIVISFILSFSIIWSAWKW